MKPRRTRRSILPVAAIAGDEVLTEAGELLSLSELAEILPKWPSTIFATVGGADLLAILDDVYAQSHPAIWQWRIADNQRHGTGRVRHARRVTLAVHFFGFKGGKRYPARFHKLIDPVTMYGHRPTKILPGDEPEIVRLLRWAAGLRDWCAENNLEVKPTLGGISSQLLGDPRFYPDARRKVPAATNERARENLPGNHYHLSVTPSPGRSYNAYYLDQHRAHHYHARLLHFPHADHLYAYGHFRTLGDYYREQPSPRFMGLMCLDLVAPVSGRHYSWLGRGRLTHQFVYSNEVTDLLDMGYRILGVRAAWGSTHRDTGLNRVADWCCDQLDQHIDARWLKPILLSTYGSLACRATDAEALFRLAKGGKEKLVLTGRRSLTGKLVHRPQKLEPGFVNVIQRGMIEAATRAESVSLARYLTHLGQRVLAIYADAVIVEVDDDRPLPPLFDPWQLKRELTHYQPENAQAYTSDQETKRPGHQLIRDRRMVTVASGRHR